MKPLWIGTRGSALAMWQADWVRDMLGELGVDARLRPIKTSGDRNQRGPLADKGGKGLFVKELESALLSCEVDLAVHSLKDVPSALDSKFTLAAFLPRADPRDCLIASGAACFGDLPSGTVLGSCSPRRIVQALEQNGSLRIDLLRGNVETRLNKVREGVIGATLLAKAGIDRLGISEPELIHPLTLEQMLPAAGQGIVGIETLADREELREVLAHLEDSVTRIAAEAERALVRELGGDCNSPIAAHACLEGEGLVVRALVGEPKGNRVLRAEASGEASRHLDLAKRVAGDLLSQGAAELLRGERVLLP
ncbi:MAG: hydroxymethylbilane synthase [Candidatus Omnitrophica bacterium]|nr:hydroxymethylbilane synthase [Candidatus Omnitrophota bacterium]